MIRPYKMVGRSLRSRIRRMRIIPGLLRKQFFTGLQSTVYLIGRYMIKQLIIEISFPGQFCSLQQTQCSQHIRMGKSKRIPDGTVNMTFRSQMNNTVYPIFLHQLPNSRKITNISFYKRIIRLIFHIFQISQIAGICQLVQINYMIVRIFIYH